MDIQAYLMLLSTSKYKEGAIDAFWKWVNNQFSNFQDDYPLLNTYQHIHFEKMAAFKSTDFFEQLNG